MSTPQNTKEEPAPATLKTYKVVVKEVCYWGTTIEAASREEAEELAYDKAMEEGFTDFNDDGNYYETSIRRKDGTLGEWTDW